MNWGKEKKILSLGDFEKVHNSETGSGLQWMSTEMLMALIKEKEEKTDNELGERRVFKNKGEKGNEMVGFQYEEEKKIVVGYRKSVIRNLGIESLLGKIVEDNSEKRDLWWHEDGFGIDLVFNKREVGEMKYFDFVSIRTEGGSVKVNGEKVEYGFMDKLFEAVISPRRGVM